MSIHEYKAEGYRGLSGWPLHNEVPYVSRTIEVFVAFHVSWGQDRHSARGGVSLTAHRRSVLCAFVENTHPSANTSAYSTQGSMSTPCSMTVGPVFALVPKGIGSDAAPTNLQVFGAGDSRATGVVPH